MSTCRNANNSTFKNDLNTQRRHICFIHLYIIIVNIVLYTIIILNKTMIIIKGFFRNWRDLNTRRDVDVLLFYILPIYQVAAMYTGTSSTTADWISPSDTTKYIYLCTIILCVSREKKRSDKIYPFWDHWISLHTLLAGVYNSTSVRIVYVNTYTFDQDVFNLDLVM